MVRQVKAFEADDGTVHGSYDAAAKHDARKALGKLSIFNEASINAVMDHAAKIYSILGHVVGPHALPADDVGGNFHIPAPIPTKLRD